MNCPNCIYNDQGERLEYCLPCMSKIHIIDLPRVLANQDRMALKYSHYESQVSAADVPASREFLEAIGFEVIE